MIIIYLNNFKILPFFARILFLVIAVDKYVKPQIKNMKIAKKLSIKKKYDFLVSTNFFAHTNNLKEIILGSKLILKDQGIMIIEVQYLYSVLRGNGFDSIHQDHRYYYTLNSIKKIFKIFGLYIFDAEFLKKNNEILRVYVK